MGGVMSSDSWGSLVRGSLSAGHHVVRHTDVNVTLSGIIYGYDYESSYAHTLPYKPVNVKDTTAPYISICHTVPVEVIGNYDRNVTAVMWMEPSVIDEEGLPITVSTNYQPGDLFPIGSTTVMYSFSDYSGNRAFCSFDVIVHDITPPELRYPGLVICYITLRIFISDITPPVLRYPWLVICYKTLRIFISDITPPVLRYPGNVICYLKLRIFISDITPLVLRYPGNVICYITLRIFISDITPPVLRYPGNVICYITLRIFISDITPPVLRYPGNVICYITLRIFISDITPPVLRYPGHVICYITLCIFISDITPPVPRCPGHLRVDSCSKKATISWPEPHVWDNSEGNVIITKDHEFGDELRGVEFIQYTFTDESGNVATCKIKVEVSKDDSLCWQLTMPFVISAVMLGLTLVPFLYTTGILVHHRRSTKSLVHRPGNGNVGTNPPCQPPCGDDDIYEDPSQFQKGDGQRNDSGLTYEEPTTSPFGEDYVEAKPTSKANDFGVNYEEPVASNDKDFAAEYEQPMASNDKDFDVAYEQPMAKHAQEILEGHFNKGNTIALS
ncbi:hypothetical protein BSL78_12761 [Apostichopus japonicus]|uniref:HYR domain-containing protein n=1 Tax=Stichopus japonicus TaxID=307972 RepID=A0A2G8KQQ7_STIJA|nr:hypothetical protein BSL78_12761 [Apostichopus japonicus]